jgi:hypothetical protein
MDRLARLRNYGQAKVHGETLSWSRNAPRKKKQQAHGPLAGYACLFSSKVILRAVALRSKKCVRLLLACYKGLSWAETWRRDRGLLVYRKRSALTVRTISHDANVKSAKACPQSSLSYPLYDRDDSVAPSCPEQTSALQILDARPQQ